MFFLFFILVLAGIATWIVPAGQYASETKVITMVKDGIETKVSSSYTIPEVMSATRTTRYFARANFHLNS